MPEIILRGKDAVKYLAEKYSWNIYVDDYYVMKVIAYPHFVTLDGEYCTDTSASGEKVFRIVLSLNNEKFCSIALDDNLWYTSAWVDHDDWIDPSKILEMYKTDISFADWFDNNIVDYVEKFYG